MLSFHKEEKGQNYKQTLYFLSFCALPPPHPPRHGGLSSFDITLVKRYISFQIKNINNYLAIVPEFWSWIWILNKLIKIGHMYSFPEY